MYRLLRRRNAFRIHRLRLSGYTSTHTHTYTYIRRLAPLEIIRDDPNPDLVAASLFEGQFSGARFSFKDHRTSIHSCAETPRKIGTPILFLAWGGRAAAEGFRQMLLRATWVPAFTFTIPPPPPLSSSLLVS